MEYKRSQTPRQLLFMHLTFCGIARPKNIKPFVRRKRPDTSYNNFKSLKLLGTLKSD
jgi:hypothetical protein